MECGHFGTKIQCVLSSSQWEDYAFLASCDWERQYLGQDLLWQDQFIPCNLWSVNGWLQISWFGLWYCKCHQHCIPWVDRVRNGFGFCIWWQSPCKSKISRGCFSESRGTLWILKSPVSIFGGHFWRSSMRSGDTSIILESWMNVFKWHIFLCISECVTCCFIQLINQRSIVFFQEWEDISSFHGFEEGIVTGGVGPLFFFTKGSNFSVFLEWGNILIVGVGRFTQAVLVSVSSLARTAYLLFSNDLGVGTVGWLVSTI